MYKDKTEHTDSNHSPVIRKVFFRFYEELNEHLPKVWRKKLFPYEFKGKPSLKNTIQAIGIPHVEVDMILVDGVPVDFDYQLKGGEQVSVYPVFESLDISQTTGLWHEPLREIRFVVDVNLGKLALKLRLLGFDTLFRNNFNDEEIIKISILEKRIILTRDKGILKQNAVTHGYWIRDDNPKKQLKEVVDRLQLHKLFRPFSRCTNCNGKLIRVEKDQLRKRISNDTLCYYNQFWQCTGCGKIYWKGSHFQCIQRWVEQLREIR